jgi:hypothetical protein
MMTTAVQKQADFFPLNEQPVRISGDGLVDFKPLTEAEIEQISAFNKRTGRRTFEARFN